MNSQDHTPESNLSPEYAELKKKYKDLQLRVTRFSVIEQQLINARNRLDREVNIHRQLQGFNRKAFGEMPDDSFGRLVAESLIDIFEVEVGMACFGQDNEFDFELYGIEEFSLTDSDRDALRKELRDYFFQLPSGKVSLSHVEDNDWIRKRIPLRNILLTRVSDPQLGITVGLLAGITDKGILHYDLIDSDREAVFGVFAQQVLSHHTNRLRTQTNRMQYQALSLEQERMSRLAQRFIDLDVDPQYNIKQLLALSRDMLNARNAFYERMDGSVIISKEGVEQELKATGAPVCMDLILSQSKEVVHFKGNAFEKFSDAPDWLKALQNQTTIGTMVRIDRNAIGSLMLGFTGTAVFPESDQNIVRILSAAIGVEERRQLALQALQDSEEKYRMIFEGTPNGIVVAESGKFDIVYANSASCQLFEYAPEEFLEMTIKDMYAPDSWTEILSIIKSMKPGRSIVTDEVSCIRKNGSGFYADISMHRISLGGRELIAGFFTDVTERRNARQILEANNIELKKINSELDNFVYSVSHDLRAPLLAIRGLINLIELDTSVQGDASSYLGMMSSSVNRMDDTIKEILEYSRNARLEVKQSPIEFREMILQCFDDVKHYFPEDIDLQLDVQQNESFFSDPNRVNTVLKNIIGNAVKYKKHSGEASYLKIRVRSDADWAHLTFSDNGEGIEASHIHKIFEMFYRASNSTVGTGLGLYICKEIVANLGGTIQVQSERGVGTVFTVTLKNLY